MQPLSQTERYVALDVLRGLALSGVLLVNLLTLFRVSLFAHITGADTSSDWAGSLVSTLVPVLLEFKAFTLFSFLFGVGVAVQVERGSGSAGFLARRFLVLLGIGLVHFLLIWNGDILGLYAVCGFLLIPIIRLSIPLVAFVGAVLIVGLQFGGMPISFPGTQSIQDQAVAANRVYAGGGFVEIVAFRWRETRQFILPLLALTLPRTLGVMVLGVAAWRAGLLTVRRKLWTPILLASGAIGVAGALLHIELAAVVALAFAYAAGVLKWLAAGGQMALTNYLTQSNVFGFVFYGYGLGYFGLLGVAPTAAGGLIFYVAPLVFSRWWLSRFRFGPAEWLWRSLATANVSHSCWGQK